MSSTISITGNSNDTNLVINSASASITDSIPSLTESSMTLSNMSDFMMRAARYSRAYTMGRRLIKEIKIKENTVDGSLNILASNYIDASFGEVLDACFNRVGDISGGNIILVLEKYLTHLEEDSQILPSKTLDYYKNSWVDFRPTGWYTRGAYPGGDIWGETYKIIKDIEYCPGTMGLITFMTVPFANGPVLLKDGRFLTETLEFQNFWNTYSMIFTQERLHAAKSPSDEASFPGTFNDYKAKADFSYNLINLTNEVVEPWSQKLGVFNASHAFTQAENWLNDTYVKMEALSKLFTEQYHKDMLLEMTVYYAAVHLIKIGGLMFAEVPFFGPDKTKGEWRTKESIKDPSGDGLYYYPAKYGGDVVDASNVEHRGLLYLHTPGGPNTKDGATGVSRETAAGIALSNPSFNVAPASFSGGDAHGDSAGGFWRRTGVDMHRLLGDGGSSQYMCTDC